MSFLGKKNLYLCHDCGHGFVTQDVDSGVTPFMTSCLNPDCGKMAQSMFYRCPQDMLGKPALEWYAPTEEEIAGRSIAVREHVKKGGLITRKPAQT